jgi:DNA-binding PadR family transcriptional regulator
MEGAMTAALNATEAALLGLLHERPMTGWDLVVTARQQIGNFWTLTQSQVYRELAGMAKAGLIVAGEPGPRDRKPYTITDRGRAAFAAWIEQDPAREQIRFPLLLTMEFAGHLSPARLHEIVAGQRAEHADRLGRYRTTEQELVGAAGQEWRLATLRFGIRHEEAVLAWLDELPMLLSESSATASTTS